MSSTARTTFPLRTRAFALAGLLTALAGSPGCTESPPSDPPAADLPATAPAADAAPPAALSLPPLPDLSTLDASVRSVLRDHYEVLRGAPGDPAAWRRMALLMHANDLRERATEFYAVALRLAPGDAMLHHAAGLLMQGLGEDDRAAAHFADAMRLAPNTAAPFWRLGMIRLNQGRADEETEHLFRTALTLDPQGAGARIGLARMLMERDHDEEAILVLRPLMETEQPNTAYAHLLAAGALQRLDREEEAAASRSRAVGARARLSDAWEQEIVLLRSGRSADLTRAIEHARAGQVQTAIDILEPLRDADPSDAPVRTNLAAFYRALGRLRESEREARAALAAAPEHPDAHFNLGATLTAIAQRIPSDQRAPVIRMAAEHLDRALALNPSNWEAMQTQGDLALAAGDLSEAAAAYARAAAAAPADAEPRHRRAATLLHLGRYEEAAESAREATALRPADPECWFALAQALHLSERISDARAALERAAALVPNDPRVAQLRARLNALESSP